MLSLCKSGMVRAVGIGTVSSTDFSYKLFTRGVVQMVGSRARGDGTNSGKKSSKLSLASSSSSKLTRCKKIVQYYT